MSIEPGAVGSEGTGGRYQRLPNTLQHELELARREELYSLCLCFDGKLSEHQIPPHVFSPASHYMDLFIHGERQIGFPAVHLPACLGRRASQHKLCKYTATFEARR